MYSQGEGTVNCNVQEEQQKQAQQLTRKVLLRVPSGVRREKARKPTEQEKKFSAYEELQFKRWDKRTYGIRQKKAAEAANAPDAKPAKAAAEEWFTPWVPFNWLLCVSFTELTLVIGAWFLANKEFTISRFLYM